MLNFNAEIYIQKRKLAFQDKHLTNFFIASIFFIYKGIIDNFNMHNILILEEIVCVFYIKETKHTNLMVIIKKNAHIAT